MQKLILFAVFALTTVAVQADRMNDTLAYVEALTGVFNSSSTETINSFETSREKLQEDFDQAQDDAITKGNSTVGTAFEEFITDRCQDDAIMELETIELSTGDWFGACVDLKSVLEKFDNETSYFATQIKHSENTVCKGIKEVLNCNTTTETEMGPCLDEATVDFVKGLKSENQNLYIIKSKLQTYVAEAGEEFEKCSDSVKIVITDAINHVRTLYCPPS